MRLNVEESLRRVKIRNNKLAELEKSVKLVKTLSSS
jgi:hypothetical protein